MPVIDDVKYKYEQSTYCVFVEQIVVGGHVLVGRKIVT
jgi:hypothetical protein